jgi:hypothetical protein
VYPSGESLLSRNRLGCWITDHLSSLRVVTDANGAVLARRDYLPFGANNARTGDGYEAATDIRQRFAEWKKGQPDLTPFPICQNRPPYPSDSEPLADVGAIRLCPLFSSCPGREKHGNLTTGAT